MKFCQFQRKLLVFMALGGFSAWVAWVTLTIQRSQREKEIDLQEELTSLKVLVQQEQLKKLELSANIISGGQKELQASGNILTQSEFENSEKDREISDLKNQCDLLSKQLEQALKKESALRTQLSYSSPSKEGKNIPFGQMLTHELAEKGPLEWSQSNALKSVDWTTVDELGCSPWLRAIAVGNMPMVEWLYVELRNHDDQDFNGNGPLHWAIYGGDQVLNFLLAHNFNTEAKNHFGQTALVVAILQGQIQMVETLMEHGADVEVADQKQRRPLHIAALKGRADILRLLAPKVKNLKPIDAFGMTPLHLAVQSGDSVAAEMMLQDYADINPPDAFGCPPLFYAVKGGDIAMVNWLARRGAILSALDLQSQSAMHYAVMSGKPAMVELLVNLGLSIRAVDDLGRYPLHLAVVYGSEEMVQLLLGLGADSTTVDFEGRSAQWWCKKCGNKNLYGLLGIQP